ncbi:hypothetical protein BgAZ_205560 [Babesia gibsoni]|uniref:Uncharacterized protein n=1 Tax=Babesia gibsoni TaxID=33632 RepID=A0AAD8LT59_BABGI|nr:hypothetical protein BgAZ_205560 [Babesia gibsoni]
MPEEKIEATGIPLFRLTLLGAHGVGKTCLVNAIMNNVLPPVYRETKMQELYYFLLRLSFDAPLVNEQYDDINAFCFEIEDTCADDPIRGLTDMTKTTWPYELGMNDYTPFGIFNEPFVPQFKKGALKPASQNRMAFLVVFDSNNYDSYRHATSIVECIINSNLRVASLQPVVCLVGNKSDLSGDESPIWDEAETFCQSYVVPLFRVSTRINRTVSHMMRELAMLMYGSLSLWEIVTHSA